MLAFTCSEPNVVASVLPNLYNTRMPKGLSRRVVQPWEIKWSLTGTEILSYFSRSVSALESISTIDLIPTIQTSSVSTQVK